MMLTVSIVSDARYRVDRRMVKEHLTKEWKVRGLPDGEVSVAFVGSRKAKELADRYLHDAQPHPVLTLAYPQEDSFPRPGVTRTLLGEVVVCFQQVALFAAQQNKSVDAVIRQFLDHALTILSQQLQQKR